MYVLEVRNAELIESLTRQAAELGITNAAIVALIGAIDSFTVSTNPAGDATAHTYSSYPLPAEMTATGEIVGGKPHIHAVMAVQGDRTIGGHLHKAQPKPRAFRSPSGNDKCRNDQPDGKTCLKSAQSGFESPWGRRVPVTESTRFLESGLFVPDSVDVTGHRGVGVPACRSHLQRRKSPHDAARGNPQELAWHRKAKALSKSVDRFTIDVARH